MSTKQLSKFEEELDIPDSVQVTYKSQMLQVTGPLGKTHKSFKKIPVDITINEKKIMLKATGTRNKDFAIMRTAKSIIRNICEGVVEGYTIKMKIVFSHFPITVKVNEKNVLIENFQGERAPRVTKIWGDTKVTPKGDDVIITGYVLTDVTQTAPEIENGTRFCSPKLSFFHFFLLAMSQHIVYRSLLLLMISFYKRNEY